MLTAIQFHSTRLFLPISKFEFCLNLNEFPSFSLDICDYVLIFVRFYKKHFFLHFYKKFQKRENYSLLAKKKGAPVKRRRRMNANVSDEAIEALWHRDFAE